MFSEFQICFGALLSDFGRVSTRLVALKKVTYIASQLSCKNSIHAREHGVALTCSRKVSQLFLLIYQFSQFSQFKILLSDWGLLSWYLLHLFKPFLFRVGHQGRWNLKGVNFFCAAMNQKIRGIWFLHEHAGWLSTPMILGWTIHSVHVPSTNQSANAWLRTIYVNIYFHERFQHIICLRISVFSRHWR